MKTHAEIWFFNSNTKQFVQMLLNLFVFFNVVSLHMMPLRAISQSVRVQPHCSSNLLNIKKNKTNENAC